MTQHPPSVPAPRHHPPIVFRTLGEVALSRSERHEPQAVFVQSKQLALLAYMCCEHRFTEAGRHRRKQRTPESLYGSHRRDTLVALLWPEHDDTHAHGALRQALHGLRHALGDEVLVTHGKTDVHIDTRMLWCDACAFVEALDRSDVRRAVSLYGGSFLSGFHAPDVPDFTRWMELARDRLEHAYATALEQLAHDAARTGDLLGSADWWRRLAEQDPYNSRIVLETMRALDTAGARGDALRLAERHETLLRNTFDAELDPEVRALASELKKAHSTPGSASSTVRLPSRSEG